MSAACASGARFFPDSKAKGGSKPWLVTGPSGVDERGHFCKSEPELVPAAGHSDYSWWILKSMEKSTASTSFVSAPTEM